MATITNNRGSALIYSGSLSEYAGLPVIGLDDCDCAACFGLDAWSEARRANVTLVAQGGLVKLTHVRHASLAAAPAIAAATMAVAA